ncbi:hypothetical protein [Bacteriovorax sp. Seq25_V]|uniref:hypothetical protein n=1 Tax=Bacteriovorax sp. Seq25_V TaxID=1201288 RepID=UPI000389DD91|nr:hypothetical protein [Bacteriovorax sp. Seq25_V]EQC47998.1 hypothetical protein M900_A0060 [Bacteriovorax sp. Seq25_V]
MGNKRPNFLQNYIGLFIIFCVVFSSLFYFENKRLEAKKLSLMEISNQGAKLTEHIYFVAQIQGQLQQSVENMINDIERFKAKNLRLSDFLVSFENSNKTMKKNIDASISEYNEIKKYLLEAKSEYLLKFLSIELYHNEAIYLNNTIENASSLVKTGNLGATEVDKAVNELARASESIKKVSQTYREEVRAIEKNIQEVVADGFNDLYSSNFVMTTVSVGVVLSLLLYTLFSLIIPLHKIARHTDSLLSHENFVEDSWAYPAELQEIITSMKSFSTRVLSKEQQLRDDRAKFIDYSEHRKQLFAQIDKELNVPMEVLNRTLHRVHEDNLSKENLKLVELAESEYLHLKDLIRNASVISTSEEASTNYEGKYMNTDVNEFLSGCVNSIVSELKLDKKVFTQIAPSIPTHIYLDQPKVRDIIKYAIESLSIYKNEGVLALTATDTKLYEEQYILVDIYFEKQDNLKNKQGFNYLSLFGEHRANSTTFKTFQTMANNLGGTLDFKINGDTLLEFRLMLPLVGIDELNEELVG